MYLLTKNTAYRDKQKHVDWPTNSSKIYKNTCEREWLLVYNIFYIF